ncbi:DUF3093 domain-containing protein [Microterricola viridarii]|uniref:DUF3093 domain-containing protein n=1 Tax=Microterricola viridarii TaxID=412690 RepID=A0A1H1TQ75_9MICO|nr:DUF3093 domain-containing protein [Microterricola viridarii]SDS62485.1 Protein of unknown function [Microterricola viridarii]
MPENLDTASAVYDERLWPNPWMFIATALVIPASILVLAPISVTAGIVTALILYAGCVALLLLASPRITLTADRLTAGRASIGVDALGPATSCEGAEAFAERGPRLDARAWLLIRGWVKPVVRVELNDPSDPTPYWLLSSRRPTELAAAINRSRRPETDSPAA